MSETFEIGDEIVSFSRELFQSIIRATYQQGQKDALMDSIVDRLQSLRDLAPAGSEVSIELTKWIHEND